MSDSGSSFTIDLPVTGKDAVDAAASSVDALAVRLAETKDRYSAAEKAANMAAKAVERLGVAAEAQRGKLAFATEAGDDKAAEKAAAKLRAFTARQGEAAAKAELLKGALAGEAAALDGVAKALAAAEKAQGDKNEEKKGPAYETIARGLKKLGGPLADLGDHVAKVGSGFEKLKRGFGSSTGVIVGMTVAVVALAAALIAAGVAAASSVVHVALWAVGLADANRQSLLLAQGMAQSVKGGEALNAAVKAAARTFPLTTDELGEMAKGLAYAGYRGKDLTNALQQSATWAARLKFGPNFAAEMLSLDQQSKVFKANLSSVFGGLKIEGLLGALQKIIALLDTSTASGHAIQVVFESIFQPLVDGATGAQFKVEAFFLDFEILALRALIAIKPWGSTIMTVVEILAIGAALIAGVVVVAVGLLLAALGAVVVVIGSVGVLAAWLGERLGDLATWIVRVVDRAYELVDSFGDIGENIVTGIAAGISKAGGAVWDALKNVVSGAVDSAEKFLGIRSPSRVFMEIGGYTAEGMALGVDRGAPAVRDSLESMLSPPSVDAAPPAGATHAASSGGHTVTGNTFVFNGVQGAEDAETRFGALLTRILEGDSTQLGATVAG